MARFHGQKNVHIGFPVWAASEYDPTAKTYVIEVSGKDADRFRQIADQYGFSEVAAAEKPAEEPEGSDEGKDEAGAEKPAEQPKR
jgi:hypothetical protein